MFAAAAKPTSPRRTNLKGISMHHRITKTLLATACALAPLCAVPAGIAHAQPVVQPLTQPIAPAQDVVLSIGRGELVTVPGAISEIFVANDTIADVQVKSQRQLYLMGLSGGDTTVYASNAAGDIVWSANVRVGANIGSIDQMLRMAMPEADIRVATMSANTVLLTGTIAAPEDAAEAERLVQAFMGEEAKVVSRLKTATPLQVMLRVRFAEVNRSLVRAIGVNLTTVDSSGGIRFGIGQGRQPFAQVTPSYIDPTTGQRIYPPVAVGGNLEGDGYNIVDQTNLGTTLAGFARFLGMDLGAALDLGERQGLVTTLSEPNLTALSGETAEFLAGGEFPIPLSQGLGTTTVEYKNYGVSLAYTPTVLTNGRISMRVRPEVSELSNQGAIKLDGIEIPALTVRRAETTVELGSGQSFMIAGLLSNNAISTIDKAPGAGDVPILGNLFRSTDFRKGESELVIIVTPYLVKPVNDREIRLPTDGFAAPSLAEQLLLNREAGSSDEPIRPMPEAAVPADPRYVDPTLDAEASAPGIALDQEEAAR